MVGFERQNAKLLEENQILMEKMAKMEVKMGQMNGEIVELKVENYQLKEKIAKNQAYMKKKKLSIPHQIMPAELINELLVSMPFGNAFGLLAKIPNVLLARNVQKMINGIKEAMKENNLNEEDCGSKLIISKDGLEVKHSGPPGYNCIRALFPIPNLKANNKPIITFYYEMEILKNTYWIQPIIIGFCGKQFPLEDENHGLELNSNSIGIGGSTERIWIDGYQIQFNNVGGCYHFQKGDFVGLGIIQQPNDKIKCFATCNGQFLVKAEFSANFANIKLFPSISLYKINDSVRLNFGKEEWKFKEFGRVLL